MWKRWVIGLCLVANHAFAAPIDDALRHFDSGEFEQAATLLKPLAESGDAVAQHRLAVMFFYGRGVPEDEKQALALARKSADQGNVDAMFFLGNIYVFGDKIPVESKDPDQEAAKWYFEAASRGHSEAEYSLGLMLLAGKGVIQSQEEALKWIKRAADHGHVGARNFLGSDAAPPAK